MNEFRYEMTIDEDGRFWFEITTSDLETARAMQTYCEWLCGTKLKEAEHERPKENSESSC